jgi:hypothetical protein
MSRFGWAYIDCADSPGDGAAHGPTGSVQFLTGSGNTSGSYKFMYHTASHGSHTHGGYDISTLVLSGNLIVTGTVSASVYNYRSIQVIDATGSTFFGDTNDDRHIRTGSFVVTAVTTDATNYTLSASVSPRRAFVRGFNGRYQKVEASSTTIGNSSYIIGCSASANQTLFLPSASLAQSGALMVIKDEYLHRASTAIYISASVPPGSGRFQIEGGAYYILTGTMPAINLYSDGANWYIF